MATRNEVDRLALSARAPVLVVRRIAYAGDTPVELSDSVLDAAGYVLRYDVSAAGRTRRANPPAG
jgi:DNA-binding GntR family transcriptional regulator